MARRRSSGVVSSGTEDEVEMKRAHMEQASIFARLEQVDDLLKRGDRLLQELPDGDAGASTSSILLGDPSEKFTAFLDTYQKAPEACIEHLLKTGEALLRDEDKNEGNADEAKDGSTTLNQPLQTFMMGMLQFWSKGKSEDDSTPAGNIVQSSIVPASDDVASGKSEPNVDSSSASITIPAVVGQEASEDSEGTM